MCGAKNNRLSRWSRRYFTIPILAAITGLGLVMQAHGQTYPERPIYLVSGSAPGGLSDIVTRITAEALQKKLGQPVPVITRTGAGGGVAAQSVIQSPPDGYTVLSFNSGLFPLADLQNPPPYTVNDLIAVAMIAEGSGAVLAVRKGLPVSNLQEFIAYAKANPNKLHYGSNGQGAPLHLSFLMLMDAANIQMTHIPYRSGGPAAQALIQGEIDVMFMDPVGFAQQIKDGIIIPIARAGDPPSRGTENLPNLSKVLPGFDATTWFALGVPAGTPAAVVDKLNKAMNEIISEGTITQQMAASGLALKPMTQPEAQRYVAENSKIWRDVIRKHNLTAQ